MSDDEYYYDSPYEDFSELLYDADPAPDLADDLAEHALYSPIWQDEPVGQLQEYFSDWEYYSDDYYDDDPNLLRINPQDGTSGKQAPAENSTRERRGRKRKIEEMRDSGTLTGAEKLSLARCIQGTVWAQPLQNPVNEYRHGDQDRVALVLSKDIIQAANGGAMTFGKGQLKRDDTWANDLSLADMGLQTDRRRSTAGPETKFEDEEAEEDENADVDGPFDTLSEDLEGELDAGQTTQSISEDASIRQRSLSPTPKRRRLSAVDSVQFSPKQHRDSSFTPLSPAPVLGQVVHGKQLEELQNTSVKKDTGVEQISTTDKSQNFSSLRSKKRKLSIDAETNQDATRSTASTRAKRIASSQPSSNIAPTTEKMIETASKRTTRARNK